MKRKRIESLKKTFTTKASIKVLSEEHITALAKKGAKAVLYLSEGVHLKRLATSLIDDQNSETSIIYCTARRASNPDESIFPAFKIIWNCTNLKLPHISGGYLDIRDLTKKVNKIFDDQRYKNTLVILDRCHALSNLEMNSLFAWLRVDEFNSGLLVRATQEQFNNLRDHRSFFRGYHHLMRFIDIILDLKEGEECSTFDEPFFKRSS